ncbi:TM2 domain-containing protein [Microbacterium halotolerans]|uniref:TM2 domain-containing protein n=1 Tax=Microbacterium halotolerans TaxID=246613 RepID=UPI001F08AD49|nr:TM2 domain-containing protein [Microbacterium halotolerans]
MPKWFSVRLPGVSSWTAHSEYWRSAIVDEARKFDSSAFTGRNLMRVFNALHTQRGVVLEPVMVLIDVPRERVVLAAFPGFFGDTIGNGVPVPTLEQNAAGENVHGVQFVGADDNLRNAAAAAERRVADENNLHSLRIEGPDDRKWNVYLKQLSAQPSDFLEADGHTLTQSGAHRMAVFVRGVVLACREWLREQSRTELSALDVQVTKSSPTKGPILQESLAPAGTKSPQPTPPGGAGRTGKTGATRANAPPEPGPGWYQNHDGDEQWWDGSQWGPYPPPPRVQTVYTVPHPESKSLAVAYLLFFSLGWFGAHRFYMGNIGHGVGILLTGLATCAFGIAAVAEGLNDVSGDGVPMLTSATTGVTIVLSILMIMFLVPELFALPRDVVDHNAPLMTRTLRTHRRHRRREDV